MSEYYEARRDAAGEYAAEKAKEMVSDGDFDDEIVEAILNGDFDDTIADYLKVKKIVHCPFCGRSWSYNGNQKHYATCPDCRKKVRLHPYVKRGYAPFTPLKFPNANYKMEKTKK